MKNTFFIRAAAILGALAVGLGAFATHGLSAFLSREGRAETFETAVRYHFYHTMSILLVGILILNFPLNKRFRQSATFFLLGIILFSGSLYFLSFTGITWVGAITPLCGLAFIIGWFLLIFATSKNN